MARKTGQPSGARVLSGRHTTGSIRERYTFVRDSVSFAKRCPALCSSASCSIHAFLSRTARNESARSALGRCSKSCRTRAMFSADRGHAIADPSRVARSMRTGVAMPPVISCITRAIRMPPRSRSHQTRIGAFRRAASSSNFLTPRFGNPPGHDPAWWVPL